MRRYADKLLDLRARSRRSLDSVDDYVQQILALPAKSALCEERPARPVERQDSAPKLVCFYLPQFHEVEENNIWWGEGFTEWTLATSAVPQFVGHEQPKLPGALGFYDLSRIEAIQKQVDLARYFGVHGFCFYYYYFSGRRILQKPLDLFFESAIDFPFCICWANENWTRRWDGGDRDILLQQDYANENDTDFALSIAPLLRDERYIRVSGRPLLLVYRPTIIDGFRRRVQKWREIFHAEGVGDVCIYMVQTFGNFDPYESACDGAVEFPPHNIGFGLPSIAGSLSTINPRFGARVASAHAVLDSASKSPSINRSYPWIRGINPSWDNTARRPQAGWLMHGADPDFFERWLRYLAGSGDPGRVRNPERYIFVNAWNEWSEGAYLEPDRRYGYAYLNRIARVLDS